MSECQDIYIFINRSSKEAIHEFLRYYLENADILLNGIEDESSNNNFKIYDYDSYVRDHNSSINTVRPQFSFLFPRYYLTIMVDLSASMFTTTNDGDVKIEKGLDLLKDFLYLAVKSCTFNNGSITYTPEVIVNVLCFNNTKITVILKGWELRINKSNFADFCSLIFKNIYAEINSNRGTTSSGETFFGILREGIISLNLLVDDKQALKHLLILSDGQYPVTDGVGLDRCLLLLRHCNISCNFIHIKTVGSTTTTCMGSNITDQGHDDQLRFIANCTGGVYKTNVTGVTGPTHDRYILCYHYYDQSDSFDSDSVPIRNFTDRTFNIPPINLIFTIVNMGYFISAVNNLRDSRVEIELCLQWRADVYFKIAIVTKLPLDSQRKSFLTLSIFGQNYFLHTICKMLTYDSTAIDQILLRCFHGQIMKDIRHSLRNIEIFAAYSLKQMYTIPTFINNGLKPMLSPTNQPCDRIDKHFTGFFDFWKKTLDFSYLHCFQTTNLNLLLEHDYPFPNYLSSPDPINNKYSAIQSRVSLVQLSGLINKNFCSFIVKENNTYVKLFFDTASNQTPISFCVLKMNCDGLEVKLLAHFFIPTPENIRQEFVSSLVNKISTLKFQPRGKQARPRHMSSQMANSTEHVPPQQRSWEQINCCTVLDLDLSNLLATYNPIKTVDAQNNPIRRHKPPVSLLYLYNHCHYTFRIWTINDMFMNNIFETLIKIRLQEGFHIAISDYTSGFINLVKEITLMNNEYNPYKCFIQYLIYPDNGNRLRKDSDDTTMSSQQLDVRKIVTEILIEKKYGKVIHSEPEVIHWDGLSCEQIPDTINELDQRSIETFVTFECFKIYPMTLPRESVKPNICSVLNKSPHYLLRCPLFVSDTLDHFLLLNNVFLDLLDTNLKRHEFDHIDITRTESANFNQLTKGYDHFNDQDHPLAWNCYYITLKEFVVVVMIPSNYLEFNFQSQVTTSLPLLVYCLSLKHLSFLIEDSWTLKIPDTKQFSLPLDQTITPTTITSDWKGPSQHDKANEFGIEIETIVTLLRQSVHKLDSIYLLTFVCGVHQNLRENHQMTDNDLTNTFGKYCSELMCYVVDATKFITTICSHCFMSLRNSTIVAQSSLSTARKENCELKQRMHRRIVARIRQMMAKYFKEVTRFPHILIYCPENESEASGDGNNDEDLSTDDVIFCRQKSQDNQCNPSLDMDYLFADSVSEVKSTSSMRLVQSTQCPLFISINYTLSYDGEKKYLEFDNIPTCISDFFEDIQSMVDDDINFSKLKFNLDIIPITYLDEDLNNSLSKSKNDDHSLTGEINSCSKQDPSEITKRYLTTVQTQLLDRCKTELLWTLEDEIVNCLKYYNPVDGVTIDCVKRHIINTSTSKLQKNFINEIVKKTFDLDFVFGYEKSKLLFQRRFEKITLGKYNQYRIGQINGMYCVFQKGKRCSDPNALLYAMFPDQTFNEMDDISYQSRMRVDSLCMTSLQTASDNLKGDYLRRCSSEGKLNDLKTVRKMCESKRESVTLFDKVDNQVSTEQTRTETNQDSRTITSLPYTTGGNTQFTMANYSTRQYRSPMPSYQQSNSQTPKRHRSGEASSIMCTGNYRSDTPMQLNDLVSTATSSKGYEGDSSRVSDGEEYDRFSNCPIDNKVSTTIQDDVAPFWLLLEILDGCKQIDVYFHHTDTCTMSGVNQACDYCDTIDNMHEKIKECVHQVNQCLLLEQLAQTQICRDILVSEISVDTRGSHNNQMYDYDYDDENPDYQKKFDPDTFACPLILKIIFKIHPRLKATSEKNCKVIGALRASLENLIILNRRNMLFFINENTNEIFYSLLNEVSKELNSFEIEQLNENSVLITDHNNTDTEPGIFDCHESEGFQQKNADICENLSTKSAPAFTDSRPNHRAASILKSKTMDLLELSVHGVDKLTDATVRSIITNIGSKLDHIVLRTLSESISRCTTLWLNKEDLDFLLSIDYNNKPQKPKTFFWSIPPLAVSKCLAFCYYLKQNLQLTFIAPKMSYVALYDRFNFNNSTTGEVYIYNQSSAQGVASHAIGLLTVQLLSTQSLTPWTVTDYSLPEFQEDSDLMLSSIIQTNKLVEIYSHDVVTDSECCLKVSLWLRGQVAIEVIKNKISNLIQYALTDLIMEFIVIPRPISTIDSQLLFHLKADKSEVDLLLNSFESGESGVLQKIYAEDLFGWFPELSKSENPLIKHRKTDMFSDFNVEFLINDLVDGINDSISFNVFSYSNNSWVPWSTKHPKSGKEFPGMKKSFILIGRMDELYKKFVSKRLFDEKDGNDLNLSISQSSQISNTSAMSTCTRKFRVLLKQLPFENNCLNVSLNSSTSGSHLTNIHSQNLPEFCHVQVQNSVVVIPRQMLCIVKIDGCQIDLISYNLAKDTIDNLNNLLDNIVKNHKSRFQMLNSFIYQKLGLFHESLSQSCLQSMNINSVKSLAQICKTKNSNLNFGDITRDRKPSGSPRSFSPSSRINTPSTLTGQNKSNNNKSQATKKIQLNLNINRIYQDPYTIFPLPDIRKVDSVNDVIYQHASQFLNTYAMEMKRRLTNKKIRQCVTLFQPKKQSENSDTLSPLEQLEVFSSMKRACRVFHSVVCPILFIPSIRKSLLNIFNKSPSDSTDTDIDYDETSTIAEWMNVMSIKLLGYYAEYVQKEHAFQFVNPPRPNISQNPCSHALFQKSINNSGIYLLEVFILKGCLCVRLSAFEYRRFGGWITGIKPFFTNFQQPISQLQKTFVEDACRLCDLTHLFSFMYDFYVGMIVKSITHPEDNKKYFNVVSFLRDFVQMNSYPPMYACNHIYWMPYSVTSDLIKPNDLFEFLIRHYDDYGFMLSHNVSDQSSIDTDQLFVYNINDDHLPDHDISDNHTHQITSPSSSPHTMLNSPDHADDKHIGPTTEYDFTSIFCLTKTTNQSDSYFDLFIVTFNRSNNYPHQRLIPIKKMEQNKNVFYPAKYLSILPHKSSSPDNMLHLEYCPISMNSINTDQLPHSLAWKTFDNRSVVPLQVPLFLTLRSRIDTYIAKSNVTLKQAITDCHKDSLWQRMYQKPDVNDSSRFALQFKEFQDLINSGDFVDILELDPRLVDSMKIAVTYLSELNKCMCLLSDDCCTLLYENASPIYNLPDNNLSTHLVIMSKNTSDGFLLLSRTQQANSEEHLVELKAVFRSQDCRNRISPQSRYFASSLRDVTVMLAETAAFCIWRKLADKGSVHTTL